MIYEKVTWFPGNVKVLENSAEIRQAGGKNIGKLKIGFSKDPDLKIQKILSQVGNPFRRTNLDAVTEVLKKNGYQETV